MAYKGLARLFVLQSAEVYMFDDDDESDDLRWRSSDDHREKDDDAEEDCFPSWRDDDPRWDRYYREVASYFPAGSEERALLLT